MRSIRLLLGAAALAMLAACSGDGDGGGATISGGVVKGPVLGSTVCAFALTGGAKGAAVPLALGAGAAGSISGGCYVTPADGSYNFALPAGTSGDLLIEATGGSFCSNESQVAAGACTGGGTVINLGGAVMSSIVAVPAAGSNATVFTTPLTTAAVTGGGAGMTSARFNERFNTLAGRVIGAGTAVTPATPPTATNQPYLATAATALQNGGTLSSVVTALNNGTTTFPTTGGSGGTTATATVSAAMAGMYNLKFYVGGGAGCGNRCTYTDGQSISLTVDAANNQLSLPGKVLSNPYTRDGNPHEVIWLDADNGIEYALSDNTGSFNEINVGDARNLVHGYPTFLGQIRTPDLPVGSALSAIAGTYANPQQYSGTNNIAWTAVSITADGVVTFTGTGPNVSAAQTVTVSNIGGGAQIVYILPVGGMLDLDNNRDDRIALYMDTASHLKDIEYYVGSVSVTGNKYGASVFAGTATAANITAPGTGTWAIPGSTAITGTIDGTTMTLSSSPFLTGNTTGGFQFMVQGDAGKKWLINVENTAGIAINTNYSCVHNNRNRRVDADSSFSVIRNTKEGGNCNVYITEMTTSGTTITGIAGRFTAEVYSYRRNDQVLVLDGAFRYVPPAP